MDVRRGRRTAAALAGGVLLVMAAPEAAAACERCFGAGVDTPVTRGIGVAMLALLGVTGSIGAGIVAFFARASRRAHLLEPGGHVVTDSGEILPDPGAGDPPSY